MSKLADDLRILLPETIKTKDKDKDTGADVITPVDKDALINALENAGANPELLQQAWMALLKLLNPEFWVARDNTKKFHTVTPKIDTLVEVAKLCRQNLDGLLGNNVALAEQVVQFHFKVSNYYSLASTLSQDNFDICSSWLELAENFIKNNGLVDSKTHAIWHNLIGGHKSRAFQMSDWDYQPNEAVQHFREAVGLQTLNGSKIDNPKDRDYRHVLMCLSSTMMQEAMWKVQSGNYNAAEIDATCIEVSAILDQLSTEVLVNPDGSPDFYRRAGCIQARGYVHLLRGDFEASAAAMQEAFDLMKTSLTETEAFGQLSAIANDQASSLIVLAVNSIVSYQHKNNGKVGASIVVKSGQFIQQAIEKLEYSIKLSDGTFEVMYANIAKASLLQLDDLFNHRYAILMSRVQEMLTPPPAVEEEHDVEEGGELTQGDAYTPYASSMMESSFYPGAGADEEQNQEEAQEEEEGLGMDGLGRKLSV